MYEYLVLLKHEEYTANPNNSSHILITPSPHLSEKPLREQDYPVFKVTDVQLFFLFHVGFSLQPKILKLCTSTLITISIY
ncbi:hypothetical protein AFK68_05430 [Hydrocoleum sp. CS-953]|nr:hypothetical protein AFK68_05430 [Hydrocoleum sp. CS-953]